MAAAQRKRWAAGQAGGLELISIPSLNRSVRPLRVQLRTVYGFSRRGFSRWRGSKTAGDHRNPLLKLKHPPGNGMAQDSKILLPHKFAPFVAECGPS